MLKRTITGACLVILTAGFFLLRRIDVRLFDIYIFLFAVLGTAEILRCVKNKAFKGKADESGKIALTTGDILLIIAIGLTTVAFIPVYAFFGFFWSLAVFGVGLILCLIIKLFSHGDFWFEFKRVFLTLFYPNLFLYEMVFVNHYFASPVPLLTVFVVGALSDTAAYLVGSAIGGKKLCPTLSPKKTVSGAIGGLIGGGIGSLVLYLIYKPAVSVALPWLIFIFIGIAGAFFDEVGDLFESFIKRRNGIKDSGKILPGHGGVMDRIDGMLFTSLYVGFIFLLV